MCELVCKPTSKVDDQVLKLVKGFLLFLLTKPQRSHQLEKWFCSYLTLSGSSNKKRPQNFWVLLHQLKEFELVHPFIKAWILLSLLRITSSQMRCWSRAALLVMFTGSTMLQDDWLTINILAGSSMTQSISSFVFASSSCISTGKRCMRLCVQYTMYAYMYKNFHAYKISTSYHMAIRIGPDVGTPSERFCIHHVATASSNFLSLASFIVFRVFITSALSRFSTNVTNLSSFCLISQIVYFPRPSFFESQVMEAPFFSHLQICSFWSILRTVLFLLLTQQLVTCSDNRLFG